MSEPGNAMVLEYLRIAEWERAKGALRAMMKLSYCGYDDEAYQHWKKQEARVERIIQHIEERYI